MEPNLTTWMLDKIPKFVPPFRRRITPLYENVFSRMLQCCKKGKPSWFQEATKLNLPPGGKRIFDPQPSYNNEGLSAIH